MFFKKPLYPSEINDVYHLAPIPVYMKVFDDDDLHDRVFDLGYNSLDQVQRQMGQELPERYDTERHSNYEVNYDRKDQWVESDMDSPIGSRYFTPPNDFLETNDEDVNKLVSRIRKGFIELTQPLGNETLDCKITESWMQFYEPTLGRGHNAHNHCRWSKDEGQTKFMFSGGYYLSDGDPIKDHPYSGVFTFHIRGHQYFLRPKKGMLVIWPYDIVHSVKPFYGKTPRCVINFNIQNI